MRRGRNLFCIGDGSNVPWFFPPIEGTFPSILNEVFQTNEKGSKGIGLRIDFPEEECNTNGSCLFSEMEMHEMLKASYFQTNNNVSLILGALVDHFCDTDGAQVTKM